jgi:hypothetical protein
LLILLGLMLSIGLVLGLVGQAPSNSDRLLPNPKVPADQTIDVGLQISNVYNLSLRDKTFTAEGWYWLKWPEAVQQRINQGQIPVEGLVEFANQVERWDMSIEPANKEPQRTADGRYLQVFRFSGRFYDDHQNLSMFPFEQLELPISIETRPSSFSMANQAIVLRPATAKDEVLGDSVDLNGYSVTGLRVEAGQQVYSTSFGDQGALSHRYSRVSYVLNYRTNVWSAFYTFVVPWLAVMVMLLLAPSLTGDLKDVRLAVPSTALLTFVFLRESSTSGLPPLDYLTYIDKLYIMGFVASTVLFCLFVWSSNLLSQVHPDQEAATIARINRVDRAYQFTVLGSMVILLIAGVVRR